MAVFTSRRVGPLREARSFDLGIAGSESNVAIGLARLGVASAWIGRIGDDELGSAVLATLRGAGVAVAGVVVDPGAPTALMIKERRSGDVSRVLYYRHGSAGSRLQPGDVFEAARRAGVVHSSGITVALGPLARAAVVQAWAQARDHGGLASLDLNYRAALWGKEEASATLAALVGGVDVVFAGLEEARMVTGESDPRAAAEALHLLGAPHALVTCGGDGAWACIDGALLEVTAVPVTVVDPVGAGDAFVAGYLAGLVRGISPEARLRQAASVAALVVSTEGDWEGFPDERDVALAGLPSGEVHR